MRAPGRDSAPVVVVRGPVGAQPLVTLRPGRVPTRHRVVRGVGGLVPGDLGQHVAEDLVEPTAHPVGDVRRPCGLGRGLLHGYTASSPDSSAITCRTSGVRVAMPSRTAARDDARFTTSVLPDTPTSPRDRPASTAPAARPEARMASAMPGMGRSSTPAVASAVTSRGDTPVPPMVITRSTPPITAVFSALRMATVSPGTTPTASTTSRASSSSSVTRGPVVSSRSPWLTRSSTTTTSARPIWGGAISMGSPYRDAREGPRRDRLPVPGRTAPALGGGAGADAILHVRRTRGTTAADSPRVRAIMPPISSVCATVETFLPRLAAERDGYRTAVDRQGDPVAGRVVPNGGNQLVAVRDGPVVDPCHDLVRPDAGLVGRTARLDLPDDGPVGGASPPGERDAEHRPRGAARALERLRHPFGLVDRDGEAHADRAALRSRRRDRGVDPDQRALHVDQRA